MHGRELARRGLAGSHPEACAKVDLMVRDALMIAGAVIIFSFAALGQSVAVTPRFEVAEVHRSASARNPQTYRSGGFLRGERYDLRKATMMDLIRLAYGFEPDTVFGGPDWLEFDRFDIAAKASPATSPQEISLMLQSLLADRFKLVFHKDVRPMPVFALRVGKGPKMNTGEGSGDPECNYQRQPSTSPYTVYSCRNMTMARFAQQLRGMAGDYIADPVIDSTGLTGTWDFDLKWTTRSRVLPAGAERTTIFSAIDQQLGLRLAADKAPAPVNVIDQVNEKPTGNAPDIAELLPPRELQFEVASVRPSGPDVHDGFSGVTPGGGFEARAETMRNLFATAWDVHWDHVDEMIVGMPKWMDTARFDIQAKPPSAAAGPPPPRSSFVDDDLRLMLRALLTGRFKIKTHYEDWPVSAYTLVAAKPRMKRADPSNRPNCKEARTIEHDPRDRNPRLSRLLACQNVTMAQFADQLLALSPNDFAYSVADATGIAGRWDFMLNYTPTGDRRNPDQGAAASDPSGAMSIFEAINKQLGLKLEMHKRMLPVLVIDHIEEKPAEN
jgi:uncharacterized protein (TIGR03435 family)